MGHICENDMVMDFASASHGQLPDDIMEFLTRGEHNRLLAKKIAANEDLAQLPLNKVSLLAPVPVPNSLRNGYSFRQHVERERKALGLEMIDDYDKHPGFYFSNHNTITGPGDVRVMEEHLVQLDFELECAIVIGRKGRNIKAEDADDYIAGLTIMNDWTARGFQGSEIKFNIGHAKSKDFATSMGPYLVTTDELEMYKIPGKSGSKYDLEMTCKVNGELVSVDNLKNMHWTFAQIIERASYGVDLLPGDIIGSGTCGTGCFLELNMDKQDHQQWLNDGDVVELTVDGLGTLKNKIIKTDN